MLFGLSGGVNVILPLEEIAFGGREFSNSSRYFSTIAVLIFGLL
jgi:hypothetical protein